MFTLYPGMQAEFYLDSPTIRIKEQSKNHKQKNGHHFRRQIIDSLFSRLETNARKKSIE